MSAIVYLIKLAALMPIYLNLIDTSIQFIALLRVHINICRISFYLKNKVI